jgi:hypothetical protein
MCPYLEGLGRENFDASVVPEVPEYREYVLICTYKDLTWRIINNVR